MKIYRHRSLNVKKLVEIKFTGKITSNSLLLIEL